MQCEACGCLQCDARDGELLSDHVTNITVGCNAFKYGTWDAMQAVYDGSSHACRVGHLATHGVPAAAAVGIRQLRRSRCRQGTAAEQWPGSQYLLIRHHCNATLPSAVGASNRCRRNFLPEMPSPYWLLDDWWFTDPPEPPPQPTPAPHTVLSGQRSCSQLHTEDGSHQQYMHNFHATAPGYEAATGTQMIAT